MGPASYPGIELAVEQGRTHLQRSMGSYSAPAHLLAFAHAPTIEPVYGGLHESGRDPTAFLLPAAVVDQGAMVRVGVSVLFVQIGAFTPPPGPCRTRAAAPPWQSVSRLAHPPLHRDSGVAARFPVAAD